MKIIAMLKPGGTGATGAPTGSPNSRSFALTCASPVGTASLTGGSERLGRAAHSFSGLADLSPPLALGALLLKSSHGIFVLLPMESY